MRQVLHSSGSSDMSPEESLLRSTSAVQACQDTEKLEGSHIQVMDNMPVSVIAVLRAALTGVQSWG